MKIIGWIREGDKAACGGTVIEGLPNFTSHGIAMSFKGAAMACRKHCHIGEAHSAHTLPNVRHLPHHGHKTVPGGCPLISTLNDIHGRGLERGANIPLGFYPSHDGEWTFVFAPQNHEDSDYDQHLVIEDQDGQPLEGIPYKLTDARAAVIFGTTGSDGKTQILAGNSGETLDCHIAKDNET